MIEQRAEAAILEAFEAALSAVRSVSRAARPKGDGSLVTEADVRAEEAILEVLRRHVPDATIFAEESRGAERTPDLEAAGTWWAVDPIDGTTNFSRGSRLWASSIGFGIGADCMVGGIMLDDGATVLTTSTIKAAARPRRPVRELVIGADNGDLSARPDFFRLLGGLASETRAIRVPGSVAVGLAWTVLGWLDGYFDPRPALWDFAGGAALLRASGGEVIYPASPDAPPYLIAGTETAVSYLSERLASPA
jgi:myo-inositol-1(or 4)-monophosphatase